MTILIAHRGLLLGPDKTLENHPEQINHALTLGFDCEIDLWRVDNNLYLGHDSPQYKINADFLHNDKLWIHAKNLEGLRWLLNTDFNYFWHQNDDFILTSKNIIWTLPGKPLTDKSICVMPEWSDPDLKNIDLICLGICSDFVAVIKSNYISQT